MRIRSMTLGFGSEPSEPLSRRIHAAAHALLAAAPTGATDVVPGYTTLMLEWDENRIEPHEHQGWIESGERYAGGDDVENAETRSAEVRTIRVRYDGEDLAGVAARTELTLDEVIAQHSAPEYLVHALGFSPGFPFLGPLPEVLQLPRRGTPRTSVPAHAVAIAGAQTGVYPMASPGGWHLLGTALDALYDPHREPPFLLSPGDRVRFQPAKGETPKEIRTLPLLPEEPSRPVFEVLDPGLLDVIVDQGRERVGRFGLARGGPVDSAAARHANRLVGNRAEAPLLEINLSGPTLRVLADVVVAFSGLGVVPYRGRDALDPDTTHRLQRGDQLSFGPASRGMRGYLAIAGGIESATFLGSASTDMRGRIGRPLHAGDVLGASRPSFARSGFSVPAWRPRSHTTDPVIVRILPGPQACAEALDALTLRPFRVASADRMGVRLDGPSVPGGEVPSEGTPLGAIQVTSDGQPLVLLHDRGSLGGYAKPAIIDPGDLPAIAQARPGQAIKFVPRSLA